MDGMFNIFGYGMQRPDQRDKKENGFNIFDRLKNIDYSLPGSDFDRKFAKNQSDKLNPNKIQNQNITPFNPSQGGVNQNLAGDQSINQDTNFMSKLANMAGVDMKEATANWKDKGGFEGLMANPGFTLGLALMQSSAQGKRIDEGIMDNFVKAAGISAQFKDRMDARKQAPIQATSGDIAEVKSLLASMNVSDPSTLEKFFGKLKGKNVQQMFDISAEDIAIELQKEMALLQKNNKSGKPLIFDTRRKLKIIKRLLASGKFKKKGGTFFTDATLESDVGGKLPEPMAKGGPILKGKPYMVGEKGPEVVIPRESAKVLSNDDSRIFAMLLAANPQLQQVSKTRAEKIIRSRFPEYFD